MNHQGNTWEKEYRDPKLVTKDDKPQADTLRFLKFLKKECALSLENLKVLDLGCGTGRNSNYLAEMGNDVCGIDISKTAISIAKERALKKGLRVDYAVGDIGNDYNIKDNFIDIVLDVTSSNSLNEKARENYLKEVHRVLKIGGHVFVRALCKDGDSNAKKLIKLNPGKEIDTYFIKELGLTERVFAKEDFIKTYTKHFKILKLEKKEGYQTISGKIYKRNYWLAYMQK